MRSAVKHAGSGLLQEVGRLVCVALLPVLAASSTLAASIAWNPPVTVTGDTDVATSGSLLYAGGFSGTTATVNSVPFAGSISGNITVSGSAGTVGNAFAGGTSLPWAGLSANYQTLLAGGTYANNNTPLTVTLNNLAVGSNYLVQVWVNDSRSGTVASRTEGVASPGGNAVTLVYNSTQAQGGVGQSVLGGFTADAVTQSFTLTGALPAGGNSAQINALQVRRLAVPLAASLALIDYASTGQRIDGFGASSAWMSGALPTNVADLFFSTNVGIGLSLLRTSIAPDGTTTEGTIAQQAQTRGARVWGTPWTPPTIYKTTNALGVVSGNGGSFSNSPANYQGYAAILAGFAASMSNNYGVPLYAISLQNEPDFITTNYGSCGWSGKQFHDFIPYLAAALAASNVASTKILFPESFVWSQDLVLQTNTMLDAAVAPLVGIIANHNYDNGVAAVTNWGKPLWETEVSTFDAYDDSITNAMFWAGRIHAFLTLAQVSAWHYWWLSAGDNEGLTGSGFSPAKRMYVLGNYSRFVRPNAYRIGVANNSAALVSAFVNPAASNLVIVAVNTNAFPVSQTFTLTNFPWVGPLRQWVTSATESLGNHGGALTPTNRTWATVLPPYTVTTLVYQPPVTNPPAILQPPASQTTYAGGAVTFTVQASGGTLPLYYQWLGNGTNLPGATNATLNLPAVTAANTGVYAVVVTNVAGSVTSSVANLGLNTLVWNPPVTIAGAADIATNGTLLYAANNSGVSATVNGVTFAGVNSDTAWGPGITLGSGWTATTTSAYAGGASAPWSNLPGPYQTMLQGGVWNYGGPATVTVNNLVAGHPYLVQVWVNDSRAGGTTNRTETLTDAFGNTVTLAYNNTYAAGGVGQFATGTFTAAASTQSFTILGNASTQLNALQVRDLAVPPGITQPPTNQTAYVNGAAAFSVTATGSLPLNYQWYFNTNAALPNATNATQVLTGLSLTNAGTYSVVISNYAGSLTSTPAMLTVLPLPHPVITRLRWTGANLICSGTNGTAAGSGFLTLATTNLALPLTNWTVVATNAFGPGGGFTITNAWPANGPRMFLILRLP